MNTARFAVLVLLCLAFVSCGKPDYIDSNGNSGNFSDHRGRWMIINYWAVWCKPCIKEVPELNQFAKTHSDKAVLFGVDFDDSQGKKLQQHREKLGIEFPVLSSDPTFALHYQRPSVLPTTLVFNPDGQLHRKLVGPQTEQSLLQAISE